MSYATNLVLSTSYLISEDNQRRNSSLRNNRNIPPPPNTKPQISNDLFIFGGGSGVGNQKSSQRFQQKTPDQLYPNLNANLIMLHNQEDEVYGRSYSNSMGSDQTDNSHHHNYGYVSPNSIINQNHTSNPRTYRSKKHGSNSNSNSPSLSPSFSSNTSFISPQLLSSSGSNSPSSLSPSSSRSSSNLASPFQSLNLSSPSPQNDPQKNPFLPPRSLSSSSAVSSHSSSLHTSLPPRARSQPVTHSSSLYSQSPPSSALNPNQLSTLHEYLHEDMNFEDF